MTPSHQFCLKWNNHSNNLLKVFGRLFSNESFTDVTLAAEGRSVRAHKMVLSACSTYFEQLFLEHPEPNPIVIMRETSYTDLAIIVEFMYKGEINVSQEQLGSLLRTAESLRVKGLAQASTEGSTGRSQNGEPQAASAAAAADEGHPNATPPPFSPPHSASSSSAYPHVHPPPALLPLFQSAAPTSTVMDATSGGDSPSLKRKRGRPKMDCASQDHSDSASSPPPSIPFIPRMENIIAMSGSRSSAAEILEAASTSSTPNDSDNGAALDLRLTESSAANVADLAAAARIEMRNSFHGDSEPLRKVQQEKNEPHCYFRGYAVYKFNDYIAHGTRQQYWEEPFTKAVMEGIQDRELDLKKGAELLGVSYSTLYGRYRESHGYLRHAWTRVRDRPGGDWWDPEHHEMMSERIRRENGTMCPNVDGLTAEELVVEVDSYDVLQDDMVVDKDRSSLDTKESLILSIRHGKVQRKLAKEMMNKQPI